MYVLDFPRDLNPEFYLLFPEFYLLFLERELELEGHFSLLYPE